MKKIRIGNTVALSWEIFIHDGDEVLPYDLTGKAVSVYLINAFATVKIEDFITEDNVLSFTWEGSEQRFAGVYQLTLVENENTDTMLTFDECEAFELVRCSCSDDENEDTIEKVELSSKLNMVRVYPIVPVIGPNSNWWVDGVDTGKPSTGMSAYEFAKENGYTGTEAEYAAECAAVPALNEESRVATAAASEAADNADRAAGEARRSATVANSASATATNAALAAKTAAKAANDAADAANKAAGNVGSAIDNANSAAEAANDAAQKAEEAIAEFGPAIANKADLENGKIVASQIPDYLLGQVMFGGLIYINNSVITTVNFDAKYGPFSDQYVIIDIHEYYKYEGVYFIAQEDGIILDIDVKIGDWIVSTGYSWEKIDNTDAVTSVAGLVGNVNASSLAAALSDITDSNSLARKTDLPKKLSELENDIEIGGGGGSYDDSEIKEILSNIVDEEGYLYSNGEKVDMRFTRSLLPVGTSIPAKANLNTIEFLKIGKYYCSQNVDAKTVKNCPVNMAFSMEVFNPLGTNVDDETTAEYTYRLRVLTPYDTGIHYMQCCRTSGTPGTWTYDSWYVTPRSKFALASSKNDGSAAIGATNKGVYIDSNGEIKAMSYTIAKSVPSNAVFTDTNTKVTSVGNHYAPAEDEDQQIDAPEGEVVTGLKRDAAGHVVGVVSVPQSEGGSYDDTAIRNELSKKLESKVVGTTEPTEDFDINAKPMVSVTYAELVELRDNGKLVAGMQYRITDFVTTTAQENTRSAGHQFDVIVTADNDNTLNEVARACKSELDIEKYKDAFCGTWGEKMLYLGTQEYEGKEYHLYESESQDLQMLVDFNQIKAYHYQQSDPYPHYYYPSFARGYDGSIWEDWQVGLDYSETIQFKYNTPTYFANSNLAAWQIWYSLDNDAERFAWADAENGKGVIYRMIDEWNNDLPYDFKNIMFVRYELEAPEEYIAEGNDTLWMQQLCNNVRAMFDKGVRSFVWAGIADEDKYWEDDMGQILSHTTGENFAFFTFNTDEDTDASLSGNIHGNKMQLSQTLPNNVFFGNSCSSNSFGNGCHSNSFGINCYSNSFGNDCYYNSFGNDCYSNSFGINCYSNSFGNDCSSNSFGNECNNVELRESTTYKTASVNSIGEAKVFNLADLADLLNS